jgi:hypothetical protein
MEITTPDGFWGWCVVIDCPWNDFLGAQKKIKMKIFSRKKEHF